MREKYNTSVKPKRTDRAGQLERSHRKPRPKEIRWIENQNSGLTRLNILRRVSPGTYAINTDREVQK